jgi:PAS domain S-box-containing protein
MGQVTCLPENRTDPVLRLAGYHGLELLHEGSRSVILRGRRDADNLPVIIKQVSRRSLVNDNINRLRHEYHLLCDLNIPGIIRPLAHQQNEHLLYTVFHDQGGDRLRRFMRNEVTGWQTLLPLMRQLSELVGRIHEAGIIHKQITPDNIIVDPASGRAELIDFTLATRLDNEEAQPESTQIPPESLPYMAPEQSGRINRRIDFRTDFYSLGITFYELLTGHPPFVAQDRLELIHSHIARHPPPLQRPDREIPQTIADIVLKLLAKDAAQRYQSNFGLVADLDECIRQQQATGRIAPFPIARQDRPERFLIPQRLYGREPTIAKLLEWYGEALRGRPQTVLISGYSGIGKSSLVNEIREQVIEQNGIFISGKFDQFSRSRPYSAIVFALQSLIRQLLTESEQQISLWRARLQAALGGNALLMIRLIPELELIIGQQIALQRLPAHQEQNLVSRLFVRLMEGFASHDRALVLFLDDLQWADIASFNIINTLTRNGALSSLMLIASYRDQEIRSTHPIRLLIDNFANFKGSLKQIRLEPLNQDQISHLLADTLHRSAVETRPLARICLQKTHGNPFFLKQFLGSLHGRRLIYFRQGKWHWDEHGIRAQEMADDVITLLVTRIEGLPRETQQVLKLAACIGSRFNLKTLSVVYDQSYAATIQALWPSLPEGLLIPLDNHYQMAEALSEQAWYRFVHDRVQQAAYSLVLPGERQALHLQIGQLLRRNTPAHELDDHIFEIVNHLNLAKEIIEQPEERIQLAELNLQAGLKARQSAACEGSAEYFQHGLDLLPEDVWSRHYRTSLAIHTATAESAFGRSDFVRMTRLIEEILTHTHSLQDELRIHELRIQAETACNRFDQALKVALEVLARLGIHLPESPGKLQIHLTLLKTQWQLGKYSESQLLDAPEITNHQVKAALPILTSMFGIVKFSSSALRPLVMAKQVELTLRHGLMACSAQSFAGYGGMLCGYYAEIDKGYALGQLALRLDQRLPSRTTHHKTLFLHYTYIAHWKQPLAETLEPLLQGHHLALDCGDVEWGAYALATYIQYCFFLAPRLEALKPKLVDYLYQIRLSGQKQSEEYSLFTLQTIDNLLGNCKPATRLEGEYYRESEMLDQHKANNHKTAICLHYFYKAILHYLFADYAQAVAACRKGLGYLGYISGTYTSPYFLYLSALAEIARLPWEPLPRRLITRRKIAAILKKIERFAAFSPRNHKHHVLLIRAELCRVAGNRLLAMSFYENAITAVEQSGFTLDRALCNELAGRFYSEWGKNTLALANLQKAWTIYMEWGALSKCDQMIRHYQHNFAERMAPAPALQAGHGRDPGGHGISNQNLDITSVLKAAHTIADEIVLERILDRLMTLAMESAGAQRSVLMLNREGELTVAADADMDGRQQIRNGTPVSAAGADIPLALIHYVSRAHRSVVIDSTAEDQLFLQDSYLRHKPPCSILCLPILYHGALTAVLYLENNEARSVFTPERVATLKVLAAQAAISIETAKLYRSLEQSEREFRSLVENAIEGIFRISPRGEIISVNPALITLLGYDNPESFISTMTDIGSQCFCDRAHLRAIRQRLESEQRVAGFETLWHRRNGDRIHVSISARKVVDDHDNLIYYEGTIADISARKAREQAEQDRFKAEIARQKAEAEAAAKSQFLATMSHEIRTPMNGVLGMAQLLLGGELTARQRAQVGAIYQSGQSLLDILNSVLDFSKLEAGKMEFATAPLSLGDTLNDLGSLLRPLAQGKGLTLRIELADDLPELVLGDARALHQILLNLCSNAIKFTSQGTVTLRARPVQRLATELLVRFEVEDSGIGIPPEANNKIFQHFSQADSSITRHYGGTGLGLAICKKLVEQQGGEIGFLSTPGQGTRFWFQLNYPLHTERAPQPQPVTDTAIPPLRILLVEDTPINQDVTVGLLAQDRHRVDVAADGFDALECLAANRYDLILMDIHLPRMDGMQTTRRIRALPDQTRAAIPVIALTASVTDEEIAHYYRAGMNDVIGKPILYSTLRETLERLFGESAERQARQADPAPGPPGELLNHTLLSEHIGRLGHGQFGLLLEKYYAQADTLLVQLEQATVAADGAAAGELLHKLAGASGNFGLEALRQLLAGLEAEIGASPETILRHQLQQVRDLYAESRETLEGHLAELAGAC